MVARLLASSQADYVTGTSYYIDGGLMQNIGQGARLHFRSYLLSLSRPSRVQYGFHRDGCVEKRRCAWMSRPGRRLRATRKVNVPDGSKRRPTISPNSAELRWTSGREALEVCLHRHHLVSTVRIAIVVGTILFVINQLDVVLAGRATAVLWIKVALTYLVPFCVSNWGILVATRRR